MKTKTNAWSKFLIASATLLCCFISVNSFAQNPIVPTLDDFRGTWTSIDQGENMVQITLTDRWTCTFTVNGSPLHPANAIVGYRLPEYSPKAVADHGTPASSEVIIKFYTQNAIAALRAPQSSATQSGPSNNSTVVNMVEQIYSGVAAISQNASGQMEMSLYIDMQNFSSVAPTLDNSSGIPPYCVLVKQ